MARFIRGLDLFFFFFTVVFTASALGRPAKAIDGGIDAKDGEYPAVFGFSSENPSMDDACTAFLVHARVLLTTAHCLQGSISIDGLANGTDIRRNKTRGYAPKVGRFAPNPSFTPPLSASTQDEKRSAAANDIGYIVLKEDASDIAPLPVYVSDDGSSIDALNGVDTKLIGYGLDRWSQVRDGLEAGTLEGLRSGVKKIGRKQVTSVDAIGFLKMGGQAFGSLPGDSGGPVLSTVNGHETVVALNHGMNLTRGSGGIVYDSTIATLLTKKNLCWVEANSGIHFTHLDCF